MSLGTSVSGGYGPVRASVNAALNRSTRSYQQVTVSEQTTSYLSNTIHNPTDVPVAYLRWQLTDVVTVLSNGVPTSTVAQGVNPTIVLGPYWVASQKRPAALLPDPEAGEEAEAQLRDIARQKGLFLYR